MPIERRYDKERQLTIFKVTGQINLDEILAALEDFYSNEPTLNALWDYRKGDMNLLSHDDATEIMEFSAKASMKRAGGKTALVCENPLNYGMGRMLQIMAESNSHQTIFEVFQQMDDADDWLAEENLTPPDSDDEFHKKNAA